MLLSTLIVKQLTRTLLLFYNYLELGNCITISNTVLKGLAKLIHIPCTQPSLSDPERGHVLVTHDKQGIASGII